MLSIIRNGQRIMLRLNGRLEGSCAENFSFLTSPGTVLDVDLGGLTFVDPAGERMLVRLREIGATFHGVGLFAHRLRRRLLRSFGWKWLHLNKCGADSDVLESVLRNRCGVSASSAPPKLIRVNKATT